jgi:hypothetical protein
MTTQQNNDNGHNDYLGSWRQQNEKNEKKNHKECFNFIFGLATKVGSKQMGNGPKVSNKGSTQTHSLCEWECEKNTSYFIPTKSRI